MQPEYTSKEFSILSYIDQNSDATQRDLSEHVGVSLGTINILMKRLVKKGLVKIERMQPNSVKYFLTPSGIANKIERTYGYIVRTYRELAILRIRFTHILQALVTSKNRDAVWFFGPEDDVASLLRELLEVEFSLSGDRVVSMLVQEIRDNPKAMVFTWNNDADRYVQSLGMQSVNILAKLALGSEKKDMDDHA
jgi:DNA-binding MarR family transcriptional regulator